MPRKRYRQRGKARRDYVVVPKKAFWDMKRKVDKLDQKRAMDQLLDKLNKPGLRNYVGRPYRPYIR